MPRPKKGETEQEYVSRFMASEEARKDYPDEKQRAAVAYSMYRHKENLQNAIGWPKLYSCRHLEPGLVHYQDLGDKDPLTGKAKGMTLLLRKPAIDKMRNSFIGKPIINEVHMNVDPDFYKKGKAHGIVTEAHFSGEDGWEYCNFLVWDDQTKRNCESLAYSVSCAYMPTEVDDKPGIYHSIPYDGEILDGEYTHLAVVANPRYEGARIICNSIGGATMKLRFWKKDVKNAADLDLDKATVEVDGKQVPMKDLINSFKDDEAKRVEAEKLKAIENMGDDTMIEIDGKEMPLKNLKDMYRNKVNEATKAGMAPSKPFEEVHANTEDEEKKKKEAEEKKNAEEKEAKEKMEAKNAADAKAAEELKNKKHFDDLKNKAETRGEAQQPRIVTPREMEAVGRERYGSGK